MHAYEFFSFSGWGLRWWNLSITTGPVGTVLLSIQRLVMAGPPSNLSFDKPGGVLRLNDWWAHRTFVREWKASNLAGSTMVFHQGSTRRIGVQDLRDVFFLRSAVRRKILRDLQLASGCDALLSRTSFQLASEPQLHKSHRRTPLSACSAATTSRVGPTSENPFLKVT